MPEKNGLMNNYKNQTTNKPKQEGGAVSGAPALIFAALLEP